MTLAELNRALPLLPARRLGYLAPRVLGLAGEPADVPRPAVLKLALFEWLTHLGWLGEGEQERLVGHFAARLDAAARDLTDRAAALTWTLLITEYRYATARLDTAEVECFDDIFDDCPVTRLPVPAVTFVGVDLTALYWRTCDRAEGLPHGQPVAD